tara:strand:+ start:420 stop:572 length:153 start_codon:yes stop_codon:yes gene_type:complete
MKFSAECICGYQTPLADSEEDIDWDLFDAHQAWCGVVKEHKLQTKKEEEQ